VTLIAGRDDVRLAGPVADLDAGDAAALVARLNAHFASDGLRFVAATPGQWFLRSERAHAITTAPLARAIGAPLRELLPQGGDSPVWRRWQNEIEMLLHDQPINIRREAQGLPVANGLWFSDAGRRPAPVRATPGRMTLAADNAVRALAIHAGETCAAVPAGLDQALAAGGPATELVVVPAANADPAAVERQWSGPAWRALRAGSLARVTVIADGQGRALAWEIARPGFVDRLRSRFSEPDLSALLARGTADR
jgi:hypothetical protein